MHNMQQGLHNMHKGLFFMHGIAFDSPVLGFKGLFKVTCLACALVLGLCPCAWFKGLA